jgi:hypothetical protein
VTPAAHIGRDDAICAGAVEAIGRGLSRGTGDDEDIGVEGAGSECDEDVVGIVVHRADKPFCPLDPGTAEDRFGGRISRHVDDPVTDHSVFEVLVFVDDDETNTFGLQFASHGSADAAVGADDVMVTDIVDAPLHSPSPCSFAESPLGN